MDQQLVSVIVLTYRKFDYFNDCMDSIFKQTYTKIELIISDDCSDNFDLEFIESYLIQNKKSNIINVNIIHHQKNVGTVKNFNDAIKQSKGEYVFVLASDDSYYDNEVIENVVNVFNEKNALIVTAYREIYDENFLHIIERLPKKKEVQKIKKNKKLYKALCKGNFISGACTYYRKAFFEQYGLFDEDYKLLEDYPKYLKATRNNCRIDFLDRPTIKYRWGGISTSNKINPLLKKDSEMIIIKEILSFKEETGVFLNRLKKFELYRMENRKQRYILVLQFPEIVLYKIALKVLRAFKIDK